MKRSCIGGLLRNLPRLDDGVQWLFPGKIILKLIREESSSAVELATVVVPCERVKPILLQIDLLETVAREIARVLNRFIANRLLHN